MKGLLKKVLMSGVVLAGLCILLVKVPVEAKVTHTVTFLYGTKSNVQQVVDGKDAIIPVDTAVPGFTFIGWTDSSMNVKTDKLILGMYINNNTQAAAASTPGTTVKKVNNNLSAPFLPWWDGTKGVPGVTCVVRWYNGHNNELWKTEVVPYGSSLPDPADPCIHGYDFVGWEGSWKNITEDRAIKAYYYHLNLVHMIDGVTGEEYETQWIRDGESVRKTAPWHSGYEFDHFSSGWDNITGECSIVAYYRQ